MSSAAVPNESTPLLQQPAKIWREYHGVRLAVCSVGIIGTLAVYGFLQERIMAVPYGTDYFSDSLLLVLSNRVIAMVLASGMVLYEGEPIKNHPPIWKYATVSISNVLATTCQYEALKYVSFPVQMLGKSAKMVPVMVWGILISQKKYKAVDWIIAIAVTAGCTLFLLGGDIASKKHRDGGSDDVGYGYAAMGLMFMAGYLLCDGFTSMMQEKIFRDHNASTYNQMMYVNIFSAIFAAIWLGLNGGFFRSMTFIKEHNSFLVDSSILSLSAATGQLFIYTTIYEFGALVFAAIMNCRQVLSVTLSILYYLHPMTFLQIGGMVIAFGALFYKTYLGHMSYKAEEANKKKEDNISAA